MSSSSSSSPSLLAFVCAVLVVGPLAVNAVPAQQQQQQQPQDGGYAAVLWSVLDGCLGESDDPAVVCLKSKALTALDRALAKPTLVVADGVSLTARAGKSVSADLQAEQADRAALDAAAGDADRKSALLDDMLASRMDRLMATRSIVLDGAEEGRGKKKEKAMQQAMMMAAMTAVAILGPLTLKAIALMAGKALLFSKIALVLSGLIALKKLFQPKGHETETVSHHYGRTMELDAHDMAYSGQKQLI